MYGTVYGSENQQLLCTALCMILTANSYCVTPEIIKPLTFITARKYSLCTVKLVPDMTAI